MKGFLHLCSDTDTESMYVSVTRDTWHPVETGNGMNQLLLSVFRKHGEQIVMIVQSKHSLNIRFYLNTLWPLSETLQLVVVLTRNEHRISFLVSGWSQTEGTKL